MRETASGKFDVLGEIGRSPEGAVAYLARDRSSARLAVLLLTEGGAGQNDYLLEVADRLDVSIPAPPTTCPRCGTGVRGWARFCGHCGLNLWSDRSAGGGWTKQELATAVQAASRGTFEILGEMNHGDAGDIVYFARDVETGKIAALRLQREGEHEYSIGPSGVLERLTVALAAQRRARDR